MSDLRFNTILGAALAAGLAVLGLNTVSDALFAPHYPETPAYAVALETESTAAPAAAAVVEADIGTLLAAASIEAGAKAVAVCKSCHVFEQGGANGTGPYLWNVYGRAPASVGGFGYSETLRGLAQPWTAEALNQFLLSPAKYAPGTTMAFAGVKKPEDRANIIAYLHSLNPAAPPLPAPPAATEATPEQVEPTPGAETTPPVPDGPVADPAGEQGAG